MMRYRAIDNELFKNNRRRVARALKPGSIAVFNSNDTMPTNADGVMPFVQNSDLFYLTGIDQEETILLICPDAAEEKHREILFVRETSEEIAIWEGNKHTREDAARISGIDTVYWTSAFDKTFRPLVFDSDRIYLNTNEHLRAENIVQTRDLRFLAQCKNNYPLHRYERLSKIMHDLRCIKAGEEIDLIREACAVTDKTFRRLLRFIRPGRWEYEVEAEIYHGFLSSGSRRPSFSPIIASGANSCTLHYIENDQIMKEGDLVLMDFGAEYAGYAADVTRTVPVGGRFTDRQLAVYRAVLNVMKEAVSMLVPGNTLDAYQKEVGRRMERELIGLGLLDARETAAQDPEKPLYKKYFMHGTSHHLGLDVHDYGNRRRKFEPGMVFTCEPGIYIREEGIGIRLENDILITRDKPVDLTANIPIEPEEIQSLMNP